MPIILNNNSAANGGSPILSYSLEWDSGFPGMGYTALTGAASDSLVLTNVISGLTAGSAYEFRYRVRNVYGWGDYSSVLTTIAARPPSTPAQPITSNTGTSVRISWVEPYNGGSPITAIQIEIRSSDNTSFYSELLYCNGVTDTSVRARGYCVIPMSALRVAPHSLQQGNLVVARIRASNAVGNSPYSDDAVISGRSYADIRTKPVTPSNPPARGPLTSLN